MYHGIKQPRTKNADDLLGWLGQWLAASSWQSPHFWRASDHGHAGAQDTTS